MTLAIDQAITAGQIGMERAADHANRVEPGWTEVALEALKGYAGRQAANDEFTIEEARAEIAPTLPAPPDLRAFGAVTQMALRRGVIKPTGGFKRAASSHASPKPLYRRGAVL